jgi:hypothetical protein
VPIGGRGVGDFVVVGGGTNVTAGVALLVGRIKVVDVCVARLLGGCVQPEIITMQNMKLSQ